MLRFSRPRHDLIRDGMGEEAGASNQSANPQKWRSAGRLRAARIPARSRGLPRRFPPRRRPGARTEKHAVKLTDLDYSTVFNLAHMSRKRGAKKTLQNANLSFMSAPRTVRSHTCGEIRTSDLGKEVTLCGWVAKRRDHGGLIFADLRDRYGVTQVVFDPALAGGADAHERAGKIRSEFVIWCKGKVRNRPSRHDEHQTLHWRDRSRLHGHHDSLGSEDASVSDRRRDRCRRDGAPEIPLSRSAPQRASEELARAPSHALDRAQSSRSESVLRSGNADPVQVHARRRA